MADLPIHNHKLLGNPTTAPGGEDTYAWRVFYGDGADFLVVKLGGSDAVETGLTSHELHQAMPVALKRLARGRLTDDRDVLEQLAQWDAPVVLTAERSPSRSRAG